MASVQLIISGEIIEDLKTCAVESMMLKPGI